jgi:integrase
MPDDFVFPPVASRTGNPFMSPDAVSGMWIRLRKNYPELPDLPFYSFRHTHASYLIGEGMDPAEVARRLGHKNALVTQTTYIHAFATREKDAVATAAIARMLRGAVADATEQNSTLGA